jgi:hypothetical protein
MDRQLTVRKILGAWINQNYDDIYPHLHDDVIYTVGEGAARSICRTPGVFAGKEKVKAWYASHTVIASLYGTQGLGILCLAPKPPHVNTYEDTAQDMVTAHGFVGTDVQGELPCIWMSLWHFKGDYVDCMVLTADGIAGIEPYEAVRRRAFAAQQSGEFDKVNRFFQGLAP